MPARNTRIYVRPVRFLQKVLTVKRKGAIHKPEWLWRFGWRRINRRTGLWIRCSIPGKDAGLFTCKLKTRNFYGYPDILISKLFLVELKKQNFVLTTAFCLFCNRTTTFFMFGNNFNVFYFSFTVVNCYHNPCSNQEIEKREHYGSQFFHSLI